MMDVTSPPPAFPAQPSRGGGEGILVVDRGPVDLDEQVTFWQQFRRLVGDRLPDRIVIELLDEKTSHGRSFSWSIDRESVVDRIAGGPILFALTRQGVDDGEYS